MADRATIKDDKRALRPNLKVAIVCATICGFAMLLVVRGNIVWPLLLSAAQLSLLLTALTALGTCAQVVVLARSSAKQIAAAHDLERLELQALKNIMLARAAAAYDDVLDLYESTESTTGLHETMKERNFDAATARRHLRAKTSRDEFTAYLVCSLLWMVLGGFTAGAPPALKR